MLNRCTFVILGAFVFSAGCTTLTTPWTAGEPAREEGLSHHVTIIHDAAAFGENGRIVNGEIQQAPHWLTLSPAGPWPEQMAAYESPVIRSPIRFNEALLSWNVDVPEGAGVRFDVRVGDSREDEWSPWLYVGRWGADVVPGERVQQSEEGYIDIDYFRSEEHFDLAQYRIIAFRGGRSEASIGQEDAATVRVRRIAVTFSDRAEVPEEHPRTLTGAPSQDDVAPAVAMDVPFRSQKAERPEIAGRICSPTSVTMVMAYRGVERPVDEVAQRVLDQDSNIYGNWPANVQAAYTFGVPGYVTRMNDWAEVRRFLASGQPIIASIQARRGELESAPYRRTNGHLIVVRGLDENGDVLVNDPAASTPEAGVTTYRREDMERVWLQRAAGTAYVLLPPE